MKLADRLDSVTGTLNTILANQSDIRNEHKSFTEFVHGMDMKMARMEDHLVRLIESDRKLFISNGNPAIIPDHHARIKTLETQVLSKEQLKELAQDVANRVIESHVSDCPVMDDLPRLVTENMKAQAVNEAGDGMENAYSLPGMLGKVAAFVAAIRPALWPVAVMVSVVAFSPYVGPGLLQFFKQIGGVP
jgi:hypothetical protein